MISPRHIQALRKHFQPAADSKNAVEEIGDAVQPQIYSATKDDVRVDTTSGSFIVEREPLEGATAGR